MYNPNIIRAFLFGVTGLLVGKAYLNQNHKHDCEVHEWFEHIRSKHLHHDMQLQVMLGQIIKHVQHVDYHHFLQLVNDLDTLVGLKLKIQKEGGTLGERTIAYRQFKQIKNRLEVIKNQLQSSTLPARDTVSSTKVLEHIREIVDIYFKVIIILTQNDRLR